LIRLEKRKQSLMKAEMKWKKKLSMTAEPPTPEAVKRVE